MQYLRRDWEVAKDAVMVRTFVAKFTQHPDSLKALLATAGQRLVYTRKDNYWGVGRDGKSGENKYGELLMRVRNVLQRRNVPTSGKCAHCNAADVWVSTVSATVFPYCSPGCRIALGMPEEISAEDLPPELAGPAVVVIGDATTAKDRAAASLGRGTMAGVVASPAPNKLLPGSPAVPHTPAAGRSPLPSSPVPMRGSPTSTKDIPRAQAAQSTQASSPAPSFRAIKK